MAYPKPTKRKKKFVKKLAPTKSKRKILENLLDNLVSQIVRLRDGGCVTPGNCHGNLTCSHYYPRGAKRTRWDLRNCNCQCAGHNKRHNYQPSFYGEYMLKTYSTGDLVELAEWANLGNWKFSIPELELMVETYQKIYQDLLQRKPISDNRPSLIIRKAGQ
jgi:hypothetical protein